MTRYSIHCWNCAYYDYADNHCKRFDREIPDYVLKADSNTMACVGFESLQVDEHVCDLCSYCRKPDTTSFLYMPKEVKEKKHRYCSYYHVDIEDTMYINDHKNCPNWVKIKG